MHVGELRDRVTITYDTLSNDTQGGRSATPTSLDTVWASVRPTSGSESLELREFIGSTTGYRVTIRNRADVTPKMRVSWTPYLSNTAKTLQIHGVQATPDRAFLVLTCAEVI